MRLFPPLRPEVLALVVTVFTSTALAEPAPTAKEASAAAVTKFPTARTSGIAYGVDDGDLVLSDSATGKSLRLHPLAAAVYALADGSKSFEEIRAGAQAATGFGVDLPTVYAVLDALADANLLVARATPPGSADLGTFVASDGTLGYGLVAATAQRGASAPDLGRAKTQEQSRKSLDREGRLKESDAKSKDLPIREASEQSTKAQVSLRETTRSESARKSAASESMRKQAFEGIAPEVETARVSAESAAKKESALRKTHAEKQLGARASESAARKQEESAKAVDGRQREEAAKRVDARNRESDTKRLDVSQGAAQRK